MEGGLDPGGQLPHQAGVPLPILQRLAAVVEEHIPGGDGDHLQPPQLRFSHCLVTMDTFAWRLLLLLLPHGEHSQQQQVLWPLCGYKAYAVCSCMIREAVMALMLPMPQMAKPKGEKCDNSFIAVVKDQHVGSL